MNETIARIWYVRFEYTRTIDIGEPNLSTEDIIYLHDLDEEHIALTGVQVRKLSSGEIKAWYDGVGAEVRSVLGDYVRF